MIKKLGLGLMMLSAAGAWSALGADIYEIRPCDSSGAAAAVPYVNYPTAKPLGTGDSFYFTVRLQLRAPGSGSYELYSPLLSGLVGDSEALTTYPEIGVYASATVDTEGKRVCDYAQLQWIRKNSAYGNLYDCVFKYTVKAGDFALPVRLAVMDAQGNPMPASLGEASTGQYYFKPNLFGWDVYHVDGSAVRTRADWTIGKAQYPGLPFNPLADYSLDQSGFYVQTVDFDQTLGDWAEVPMNGWRTGYVSADARVTGVAQATTLYVWSEDESAVRIRGGAEVEITTNRVEQGGSFVAQKAKVRMGTITIAGGSAVGNFEVEGVMSNKTATLVMNPWKDYYYNAATGERRRDYAQVSVRVVEPEPLSVSAAPIESTVVASGNYLESVTEFSVKLTQAYTNDVTFTIQPVFEDGYGAENWSSYIRFATTQTATAPPSGEALPTVTIRAGETEPADRLYLYALRSDEHVTGMLHLQFKATTEDAAAIKDIRGIDTVQGNLTINAAAPEITKPAEGDAALTAVAGSDRTLEIAVYDTYADMSAGGYEIWIKKNTDTETTFVQVPGAFKVGKENVLYDEDGKLPVVQYAEPGVNNSVLYIVSPVSRKQSADRSFSVTVTAPKGYTVTTADDVYEFNEGDEVTLVVTLDSQNTTGDSLYAFLKGQTEEDDNVVSCKWAAKPGCNGLKIVNYGTSASGKLSLIDGDGTKTGSSFHYDVILCTSQQWDETKKVGGYLAKNALTLVSHNIVPSVDYVEVAGKYEVTDGATLKTMVGAGVATTFAAYVNEPGTYDKTIAEEDRQFQMRWFFTDENGIKAGPEGAEDGIVKGNPDEQTCTFTFDSAGTWTVTVELKDKDMSRWGNGELNKKFTFMVTVVDNPTMNLTSSNIPLLETDATDEGGEGFLTLTLDMNPCKVAMEVELTATPNNAGSENPGQIKLATTSYCTPKEGAENAWIVTVPKGATEVRLPVSALDGTSDSASTGFNFAIRMLSENIVPNSGNKKASEYYVGNDATVKVRNVAPVITAADLSPLPGTNLIKVAIGKAQPITWSFTDVLADFKGGIDVVVTGGGGYTQTVTNRAEAAGSFAPEFKQSGTYQVKLVIRDKDGGYARLEGEEMIWNYVVESAKMLTTTPSGPSGGISNSSLSMHYKGRTGEGRVFVPAAEFSSATAFNMSWNCQRNSTMDVYAWGYKVGDVDDGSLSGGQDQAVGADGNATSGAVVANPYTYEPADGKDSFFYGWIGHSFGDDGTMGSTFLGLSPESGSGGSGRAIVQLPKEMNEDGSYVNTSIEAIFSKEYLKSDNCGDLNQDGIPDWAILQYGFGIYDKAALTLDTGSDLNDVSNYNEDNDFLPASITVPGQTNVWNTPFTAKMELRGFGDGLNRAGSDRDFSDLEKWAWEQVGSPDGWSPERPTNPTVADTDGDGMPDGYEYWFWYKAHVGYEDNGQFKKLVGERFNINHPEQGDPIFWDEIESMFDPLVANTAKIAERDSDGDGLLDYVEFALGTNPLHWDSDGDGLSDYYEVMYTDLDPLKAQTDGQNADGGRNEDGDFKASMTVQGFYRVAMAGTDGHPVYYASMTPIETAVSDVTQDGIRFKVGSTSYIYTGDTDLAAFAVEREGKYFLDKNLSYKDTFRLDGDVRDSFASFNRCIALAAAPEVVTGWQERHVTTEIKATDAFGMRGYSVWPYGKGGTFAMGREADIPTDRAVLGSVTFGSVKLLHWQVYQWRGFLLDDRRDMGTGFNPLTAWHIDSAGYVGARWHGQVVGVAKDTEAYTTLDEYLVMNFVAHATGETLPTPSIDKNSGNSFEKVIGGRTTRPSDVKNDKGEVTAYGADTDNDGVPDGWELYIQCGPGYADTKSFNSANAGLGTLLGPKNDKANHPDSRGFGKDPITGAPVTADDGALTELSEFCGTDSMLAYAALPKTPTSHPFAPGWINKFWPTDPWSDDTDCDGVPDKDETEFIYGTPTDGGGVCVAGGGMNPCSWDTDSDKIPDPWEKQYCGKWIAPSNSVNLASVVRAGYEELTRQGVTEGFVGGMDATVEDAYSQPKVKTYEEYAASGEPYRNRDYDYDGLQNWQEYLTMTIRAFRYDDTLSPWKPFSDADYDITKWVMGGEGVVPLNPQYYGESGVKGAGCNPNAVVDTFDTVTAYGSICRRDWDLACGNVYFFPDGPNHVLRRQGVNAYQQRSMDVLGTVKVSQLVAPTTYFSTDPREYDSDLDGMDDYWELFHGLNPLYGGPTGLDLLALAWPGISAKDNFWTAYYEKTGAPVRGEGESKLYDFYYFPWMTGDPGADVDGDGILNIDEAIQASAQGNGTWLHTDPSALWLTDPSYPESLAARDYQMTALAHLRPVEVVTNEYLVFDPDVPLEEITIDTPYTVVTNVDEAVSTEAVFNHWLNLGKYNYAFEINEGFDSDRDGVGDGDESKAAATPASDPQDEADPMRRQALYFPGDRSAAMAPETPVFGLSGENFFFAFTVELWARPDDVSATQTLIERAVVAGNSNPDDKRLVRKNFRLGIENGKWVANFDANDTEDATVKAISVDAAEAGKWTHLAATYDGTALTLYVNGMVSRVTATSRHPANGFKSMTTATNIRTKELESYATYVSDRVLVLGASANGMLDGETDKWKFPDDWAAYGEYYKGWLDEVRVWDGARKPEQIQANYTVRMTADNLLENRNEIYDALAQGASRDSSSLVELPAELVYHYTFDGLFAGADASTVATEPSGFGRDGDDLRAVKTRPPSWASPKWTNTVMRSTVYNNYAYVPWIPNTKGHLPIYDGTTLDSVYWAHDFAGADHCSVYELNAFQFPQTHELYTSHSPMSGAADTRWTVFSGFDEDKDTVYKKFYSFAARESAIWDTDMLPLGGAFVKLCPDFWDEQGASSTWETTGQDANGNGLPDWWEDYAKDNYAPAEDPMAWDTPVTRDGKEMTAGEAYMRDLAAGAHDGAPQGDSTYAQTADEDHDGLPDWWERLYGIQDATGMDDSDLDGLSNYAEYLLSEVFDLGVLFDPTLPMSIDGATLDYFYPIGQLYAGEVMTDHDLVEDLWEDQYGSDYASRLKWDAYADSDGDGWSNRAEARYSQMRRPIVADLEGHYDATDVWNADYPVPTLKLTVRYNGDERTKVSAANIIVQATTDETLQSSPDATWTIYGSAGSASNGYTQVLGKWSDRHVVGYLTPGNVNAASIELQSAYNPNDVTYSWYNAYTTGFVRGTRAEYDAERRKYPTAVNLISRDTTYEKLIGCELRTNPDTQTTTLFHSDTGLPIGTIDLATGAYDINLGVFKGYYAQTVGDTNGVSISSMEDQTYRIVYSANPNVGLPRTAYLGDASVGHVREGKNSLMVWADTVNENGEYDVGEPFGFVSGVKVGWNYGEAEVEISETSPICPRVNLLTAENDRQYWYGRDSGNTSNDTTVAYSGGKYERVRIVRTAINGIDTSRDNLNVYNRVVLDKMVNLEERNYIHEGDILSFAGNDYDIDWDFLEDEAVKPLAYFTKDNVSYMIDVTNVRYRIVFGNGDVSPKGTNNVFSFNFDRSFDATALRAVPRRLNLGEVRTASPTFRWTMDGFNSYTAFSITVKDASGAVIYESGYQRAPAGIRKPGESTVSYAWTAPIRVGDVTPCTGKVFENGKTYTWTVQMYNAKFKCPATGSSCGECGECSEPCEDGGCVGGCTEGEDAKDTCDTGSFMMNVPESSSETGTALVWVRYFGPDATYTTFRDPCSCACSDGGTPVVRVEAFASPDFSGKPVASGYVENKASLDKLGVTASWNAKVIGIPVGTYYFRAYIDQNNDGVCQNYESMGYLCARGKTATSPFNPTGVQYSPDNLGESKPFTIYIEDADTDNDGLPDGWEMATAGDLCTKGVKQLDEYLNCGIALNSTLSDSLKRKEVARKSTSSGMAGRVLSTLSSANVAVLLSGVPANDPSALMAVLEEPKVVEGSVVITGIRLDTAARKIVLTVEAGVSSDQIDPMAYRIYSFETAKDATVTCRVLRKASLVEQAWTKVAEVANLKVGTESAEIEVDLGDVDLSSGYFTVEME